jgi:hypothetical protein
VKLLHLRQRVAVVEFLELVLGLQTSVVVLMGNKAVGMVAAGLEVEKRDDPQSEMVEVLGFWPGKL